MWCTVANLKKPMYLNISDTQPTGDTRSPAAWTAYIAALDAELTDLIEQTTASMIVEINDEDFDADNPPLDLVRACLMQCAYYYRRRNELGLSSVSFKDANVQVYENGEFLKDVQRKIDRYRRINMAT